MGGAFDRDRVPVPALPGPCCVAGRRVCPLWVSRVGGGSSLQGLFALTSGGSGVTGMISSFSDVPVYSLTAFMWLSSFAGAHVQDLEESRTGDREYKREGLMFSF